jgi:hypothetical protein
MSYYAHCQDMLLRENEQGGCARGGRHLASLGLLARFLWCSWMLAWATVGTKVAAK